MDGISVVRVWTFIASNEGFGRRIIDYVSFMIAAVVAACFQKRPDIIVGTSPQFFAICAARAVSVLRRRPWILELRDLWPESIRAVGAMRNSFILRLLERLEMHLYRKADHIIVVAQSFVRILTERGVDGRKISVITNGVDNLSLEPRNGRVLRQEHRLDQKFVVGYIGTLGMAHALETVIDAASIIDAELGMGDIHFVFVGDGARKASLIGEASVRQLSNITFLPSVPRNLALDYLSMLDASIVHLKNTELFEAVIPSKIFECMAMGIPILMGVRGEALDIVEKAGAGIAFEPENSAQLVGAIRHLRGNPVARESLGQAGRRAAPDFDRRRLAKSMLEILERVANQ